MAKPLTPKGGSNVTTLPTRAAKGAGKSKPSPAPAKIKAEMPEAKKKAPSEKELREHLQLKLIGLRQQHHQIDASMGVLRDEIADLNAKRKEIREAIRSTGVPLSVFDESYQDAETSRVDLDRKEHYRAIIREAYGLATVAQPDLLEKVAKPAQPEVYWEAQGYQDGIAGKDGIPPKDCPPEHGQAWMRGWHMAMERNAKGIKELKADPKIPEWDDGKEPAADAKGEAPDEPPADDTEGDEPGGDDPAAALPQDPDPDAPFSEASEDELKAQKGRPAEEPAEVFH